MTAPSGEQQIELLRSVYKKHQVDVNKTDYIEAHGIGVDDMFLLMSSWSENLPSDVQEQMVQHVPKILGKALASAGIGITITSLTDFLAFVIGTTSVFMSVTNFPLYAGVAVLFCYLANVTLFSGCLAIHGRRVYSWRHFYTCRVTKSRDDLKKDGRSACLAVVCGGSPPRHERDDKSLRESFPSKFLPYFIKNSVVSVMIIVLFLGYLSAAIYGTIQLKQGLVLKNLVLDTSYYYRFSTLSDEYFPIRIPLAFVVNQKLDYAGNDGTLFLSLLSQARNDAGIDSSFERCWLNSLKSSASYSSAAFVNSVQSFLTTNMDFKADIVFDSSNSSVRP